MGKRTFMITLLLLVCLLTGCGKAYEPEIIMPDEPMQSGVADNSDASEQATTKETATEAANNDAEEADKSDDAKGSYKIWLITMDQLDQYWLNIKNGCEKAAKELGNVEFKWNSPDVNDDEKQKKCINDAVSEGVDAILVAANGPTNVNDALQNAQDAGIKIVFVDSAADFDCVQKLTTDNEAAGKTAGEKMLEDLKEKGISSGKIGIIGVTKDTASCIAREEGFRSVFEGTDFELLDTFYMKGDSKAGMSKVEEFANEDCVGIFGANETSTSAIGSKIKELGSDIEVVGFDTSDTVLGFINDGIISATMAQNPDVMGYEGLKTAVKALNGEDTGEESVDTGVSVITKDSM